MDKIPEIITASEARQDFYRLVDRAADSDQPIVITNRQRKTSSKAACRKNVVLVSEEEWNSLKETLYLYSIPGMVKSIKKAKAEPLSKAVKLEDLDW